MSTKRHNQIQKEFITVNEAMQLTSLSRSTIHNLRMNNKIKWFKLEIGSKTKVSGRSGPSSAKKVLILKKSLLNYLESCSNHFNNFKDNNDSEKTLQ